MLTFSTKNPEADVYGYEIQKDGHETVFMVKTELFDEEFRLTMPGLFNVENALAVIAASILLEIPEGVYAQRSFEGKIQRTYGALWKCR